MPVDTDAAKAREIILDVMRGHVSTLDMPAPFVRLDSVDAASMTFSATAFVHNPRDASDVKSDLLFEILQRLSDAKLPLSKPQDMVVRTLGPIASDSGDDPKT
jgi:small-conductance mechanosensitive channel